MLYKGFYIEISPCKDVERTNSDGKIQLCDGFNFQVFADENKSEKVDEFTAAVGHEILYNSIDEAEQFAKDVFDCETKGSLDMEFSQ